jgi:predicted tellurium resistance membrane protein TerC
MEDLIHIFSTPDAYISLITLTFMEIILGVDNIIFISILVGRLPKSEHARTRTIGLTLAVVFRVGLLLGISWLASLTSPVFEVLGFAPSLRDLILIVGGLFLLAKGTLEIHHKLEGEEEQTRTAKSISFARVIAQIVIIDIVFSLDSVITAVGMAQHVSIMIIAVVISVGVMMLVANAVSTFINDHPTVKILALSFLILIGTFLIADGFGMHVPKGYIYFAMAFSTFVELINLRLRAPVTPVKLKASTPDDLV